jgi:hypothetical protein
MIREYRMQLDFLVCAYVLIFVCFLVTLWRREREDGQTIAGKLVKVALEVALKMWCKGVCVVVRAVACIFKRCVYDAFLVGIWNQVSDSVCVGGEYVVGILENMISTALICVYVVYLGVCTGANNLFWFIFNRVGVIILSLIVLVREMMRGVFYYAPTFAFSTLLIICLIYLNATISRETGVHQLNTTRHFFKCADDYFQGNGSVVLLMQEVEIIGKPESPQFSLYGFGVYIFTDTHHTILSLTCQGITAAIQSYKLQFAQNGVWMHTVRVFLKPIIEVEVFGSFCNAILAYAFSALCLCIHLKAIWDFGRRVLVVYCIFYLWCMCIRCAHFGFWNGLVDRKLTYSYLTFFAFVLWGPVTKKIIGWRTRDVALAPGAYSRGSPTLSSRSRAGTPEYFPLLKPSHSLFDS